MPPLCRPENAVHWAAACMSGRHRVPGARPPPAAAGGDRLGGGASSLPGHGRHEDVGLAPQHRLGAAGRAAGADEVEVVGRGLGQRLRSPASPPRPRTGCCRAGRRRPTRRRRRRARGRRARVRRPRTPPRRAGRAPGGSTTARVPSVGEQRADLGRPVVLVDVERHGAGPEGAEHRLDVLDAVVQHDGDGVLAVLPPVELASLAPDAEAPPGEEGGQRAGTGRRPRRTSGGRPRTRPCRGRARPPPARRAPPPATIPPMSCGKV